MVCLVYHIMHSIISCCSCSMSLGDFANIILENVGHMIFMMNFELLARAQYNIFPPAPKRLSNRNWTVVANVLASIYTIMRKEGNFNPCAVWETYQQQREPLWTTTSVDLEVGECLSIYTPSLPPCSRTPLTSYKRFSQTVCDKKHTHTFTHTHTHTSTHSHTHTHTHTLKHR